jgi:hypothetical protein
MNTSGAPYVTECQGKNFVLSEQRYNFDWRRFVQERGKTGGDGEIRVADHSTHQSGRLRVHQVYSYIIIPFLRTMHSVVFCKITGVLKNRAFILKGTAYNEQMEIVTREQRVCRRNQNFRQCIDEKYLGEIFMKY